MEATWYVSFDVLCVVRHQIPISPVPWCASIWNSSLWGGIRFRHDGEDVRCVWCWKLRSMLLQGTNSFSVNRLPKCQSEMIFPMNIEFYTSSMRGPAGHTTDGDYGFVVADSKGTRYDLRSTLVSCATHGPKANTQFHLELQRLAINLWLTAYPQKKVST